MSNKYAGTKTEKNLREAFAGESQARNKYTYFASVAKKAGYEQIAAMFLKTAENEKEHAKLWFKALGELGDTPANLLAAAEGENAIVDAVGFGKDKPENNSRWAYYFPYAYSILSQPEEATDVRGAVIADYQAYLENEWVEQLRTTHKYKVNKKALKQMK